MAEEDEAWNARPTAEKVVWERTDAAATCKGDAIFPILAYEKRIPDKKPKTAS